MEELEERYVSALSKRYNIPLNEAPEKIDRCLKEVAAIHDVPYSQVYNAVFTEEMMKKCLLETSACSTLELEQCIESCKCFYLEPYGCLSRKIAEAEEINKDPDVYIKKHLGKIEDLRRVVHIAAYLYHNYDGGGLTDNAYDALEYHLRKREAIKGRMFEKVGAPPVDKIKTELPYPMPSLNKVKPGTSETHRFLSMFQDGEYKCSWSLKLDGVSGMIVYQRGILHKIYTRGDGSIGGDVTYLKDYVSSIPHTTDTKIDMVVRGEFIMDKRTWTEKYEGSYSNARAFVSGKINSGFISPSLPDIQFIAYEMMRMGERSYVPKPSKSFKILSSEGFSVVENDLLTSPTVFDVMELYKKKRQQSEYTIDGLVLALDAKFPAVVAGEVVNPENKVAFKMQLMEQIRSTKAINVEWNITRYGRYFPVVIYESVYVDGVRMHRATGHNARHIQDWHMGQGTKIKVIRSGDVIPQIKDVEVDENIDPIFPISYEQGGYEWHWQGSDIILDDIEGNKEVHIKRSVHFFETLGVPRLRIKTIEKFYDEGMTTPEEIARASPEQMMKVKGIGKKTAEMFYDSIRETMSTVPPDRFIVASTTFKSGVGRKLLKTLFRYIPHIFDLNEGEISSTLSQTKIPGFGPARIKNVSENIPKFRAYLDSFAKEDVEHAVQYYVEKALALKKKGYNPHIEGKRFVLTGFMGKTDYELEDYIYDNMGDFVDVVTSDVEAVISGNVLEASKKMIKAAELGVCVYSIQEFSERYNVPLQRFEEK